MGRKAQVIGQATDAQGAVWDVRERRASGHGWDILIGWPHGEPRGRGCGGVKAILTAELARYLIDTRPRDVALPIGLTTIKRLRHDLGLSWSWDAWWQDRATDLQSMTLEQFCARHGCSIGAASQRRQQMRDSP